MVVLVVFHLHTYSSNPTAVSGYEDDTEEGKEGIGEGRLVEPPCTQCSDGEWTDDGNDCCDELYIVSICILTCVMKSPVSLVMFTMTIMPMRSPSVLKSM